MLPFDPRCDFAFCTEEELSGSLVAAEYRQFLQRFRASTSTRCCGWAGR
jgi:hypothetical protein